MYNKIKHQKEYSEEAKKKWDRDYEFDNKREKLPTSVKDKTIIVIIIKKRARSKVQVC